MVVRRRRRLQDRQRLETSTLATHSYDYPDIPTPQSVRWRLQFPACQLGLQHNTPDGESLDSWETFNNLGLLYNPKETASFFSRLWNVGTNPDLAFASFGQDSRLPDRRVLGKFSRSQRRPSLITPPRFKVSAHSDPVKCWNFCKADWNHLCLLTGESVERLQPLDTPDIERAYQDFCESLLSAAKQCIPRGRRKNYVPCWDKECETLYRFLIRSPVGTGSDRAASSLLSRLQEKKQARWEEAVNSTDFSHSSRNAWRTINKVTGRSGRSSRLCPVSANPIASQLVKNGAHKTGSCESIRLVNKQLSDLWKIPTPEGHSISEPFRSEEFAAATRCLKPGKSPALDSIFPEFILHARSALKSWFCDFLNSCMRQLKIPKIWRKALEVAIPKPEKPLGDPKRYRPISLLCVPFIILGRFIYARVKTIIDPLFPHEQAGFRHGTSTVDQVILLTQAIEEGFLAKKKAGAVFVDLTAAVGYVNCFAIVTTYFMEQKSTTHSVDTGLNCAVFEWPFPKQLKTQCFNPLHYHSLMVNRMKTVFAQQSVFATPQQTI